MRTIRTENANKTGGKERTNKGRDQKIIVPSLLLTALFAILAAVIIMAPGDPGNDHDCIGSTPNGGDEEIIDLSITPSPANGICWSYSFDNGIGNYTISCHANVRVIQNEMKDRSAEITDRRITVEENTTDVVIILDNVYFSASAGSIGASAITLLGGSEVTLIIEGDNEIGGSGVGGDTYPGIETTGATLTIRNGEIPGELTVRGAASAAGIGGRTDPLTGKGTAGGTVIINSGTVNAYGGQGEGYRGGGAGIGGGGGDLISTGSNRDSGGAGGNVTINGGTVNVHGGGPSAVHNTGGGAGIGGGGGGYDTSTDRGGHGGSGGTITINGGIVNAEAGFRAAGLGGGGGSNIIAGTTRGSGGSGGTITINGGTVTAMGTTNFADFGGIGGGFNGNVTTFGGPAGTFTMNGDAVVTVSTIVRNMKYDLIKGILIQGYRDTKATGTMYSDSVTPTDDFIIAPNCTMSLTAEKTLTLKDGITMTNNGIINVSGIITVEDGATLINNKRMAGTMTITVEDGATLINNATGEINYSDGPGLTVGKGRGYFHDNGTVINDGTIVPYKLTLSPMPDKTVYEAYDAFDPAGMVLRYHEIGTGDTPAIVLSFTITSVIYQTAPDSFRYGDDSVTLYIDGYGYLDIDVTVDLRKISLPFIVGEFTYDGGRKYPELDLDTEYSYYVSGVRSAVNAGTYTMIVRLSDPVNCEWATGGTADIELEWIIRKAVPDHQIPEIPDVTYAPGLMLSDVSLEAWAGWTWDDPYTLLGNTGPKYAAATFTPLDTDNYEIVKETIPFNVMTYKVAAPAAGQLAFVYNALSQFPEITRDETFTSIIGSGPETDAGSYSVTVSLIDTENYEWDAVGGTAAFTWPWSIAKALLTVTAMNAERLHDADEPVFSYVITGFMPGDDPDNSITGSFVLSTNAARLSPHGEYEVVISIGTAGSRNYDFDLVNGTLRVFMSIPNSDRYEVPGPFTMTYVPGLTLAGIMSQEGTAEMPTVVTENGTILAGRWSWEFPGTSVYAGMGQEFEARFTPDNKSYGSITEMITVNILKATPSYVIPELPPIVYSLSQTLDDIELPDGWSWTDGTIVPETDNSGYQAVYNPDPENYDDVIVTIPLTVTEPKPSWSIGWGTIFLIALLLLALAIPMIAEMREEDEDERKRGKKKQEW